jgi:CIC family chloride channel protein
VPQLYGVGYPPLEDAIRGHWALWFLLVLLVGKILATSLSIAIGGSGGVFAPSLFMGAMLGSLYGAGIHHFLPTMTAAAGAYGLVGMGAVFAAAARAPITAVIIIFELTGDYRIILPLMFAIVLSTGISSLVSRDTIYTLKLRRRGIDVMRGRGANLMGLLTVAEAMQPVPASLPQATPLADVIERLTTGPTDGLPVVDEEGHYRGTVTSQNVEEAMRENALDASAGELARDAVALRATQTLEEALGALLRERSGLPVIDPDDRHVVGWLTHLDVLRAYNARLERGMQRASPGRRVQREIGPIGTARARLRGYRVVDLELSGASAVVGKTIGDVDWPPASKLLVLRRGDESIEPGDETELERGDRLTVLVPAPYADGGSGPPPSAAVIRPQSG